MAGRKKKTTHSSGMYRKRITLGRDLETRKPIVKAVYGKTKDDLENKIAKLRVERGMGIVITDDKSTWEYWANAWLILKVPKVGKSAATNYKTAVKHLSSLNSIKISKVTAIDVEGVVTNMATEGYAKRTIKLVINTASQISKFARKNHAMMLNVTEDVKAPADAPVTERKPITPEEEELIWNVKPIPPKTKSDSERAERLPLIRMLALMILNCGPRPEEVVPLEWTEIDFDRQIIKIENAYSFKSKKIKPPKSKAGYRDLPIPDEYCRDLMSWKECNKGTLLGRKYVFPGNHGIITWGEFAGLWNILLDAINGIDIGMRISFGKLKAKNEGKPSKKARLKMPRKHDFTAYQLRHTFATSCDAKGISTRVIQYLMGHATPEMTMRYTHLSNASMEDARVKMNVRQPEKKEKQA